MYRGSRRRSFGARWRAPNAVSLAGKSGIRGASAPGAAPEPGNRGVARPDGGRYVSVNLAPEPA